MTRRDWCRLVLTVPMAALLPQAPPPVAQYVSMPLDAFVGLAYKGIPVQPGQYSLHGLPEWAHDGTITSSYLGIPR
jgi:hypothetical protein